MRKLDVVIKPSAVFTLIALLSMLTACGQKYPYLPEATGQMRSVDKYRIGPGDVLEIFVWRYPEVSTEVVVRPDGYITAHLLEDVEAAGKTPTEMARDLERELAIFLRDPLVSVIVNGFNGVYPDQIRILQPSGGSGTAIGGGGAVAGSSRSGGSAVQYQDGMTLLDLMIRMGGINDYADGNSTVLIRTIEGERRRFNLRVDDLVRDGDISANVDLQPGDIIIIPESFF